MPVISVIVPVYHVEKYLPHCLDSILAQTFTDFELILVDDGSPDNCGAICDEYAEKDKRIRVIHKENGGVATARNAALDIAQGEYIAFIDSDDYIAEDWFQALYSAMVRDNSDMVYADCTHVDEEGHELKKIIFEKGVYFFSTNYDYQEFIVRKLLTTKIDGYASLKFYKNSIIQEHHIRVPETCENFKEDLGFILEYILYCKVVSSSECSGYFYRQFQDSMLGKNKEVPKLNAMNELSKTFAERAKTVWSEKEIKRYLPLIHYSISRSEYYKIAYYTQDSKRDPWREAYRQIVDKRWYSKNVSAIFTSYHFFCRYYSKAEVREAVLFSSYCLHGTAFLYSVYCKTLHCIHN